MALDCQALSEQEHQLLQALTSQARKGVEMRSVGEVQGMSRYAVRSALRGLREAGAVRDFGDGKVMLLAECHGHGKKNLSRYLRSAGADTSVEPDAVEAGVLAFSPGSGQSPVQAKAAQCAPETMGTAVPSDRTDRIAAVLSKVRTGRIQPHGGWVRHRAKPVERWGPWNLAFYFQERMLRTNFGSGPVNIDALKGTFQSWIEYEVDAVLIKAMIDLYTVMHPQLTDRKSPAWKTFIWCRDILFDKVVGADTSRDDDPDYWAGKAGPDPHEQIRKALVEAKKKRTDAFLAARAAKEATTSLPPAPSGAGEMSEEEIAYYRKRSMQRLRT